MKKLVILSCTMLFTLFLFHETTSSPIVKMKAKSVGATPSQVQAQPKVLPLSEVVATRSPSAYIDVSPLRQLPELYNGCEVTSIAMLLSATGQPTSKMELAEKIKKDPTPFQGSSLKQISQWGNPNQGFVGDITGKKKGYGVYHGPAFDLLNQYVPSQAVDLTGKDFSALEWVLDQGTPVVAWTTVSFQPTDRWVTWKKGEETIKATFQEHVVLLVGYDEQHVLINDPLTGTKGQKIPKSSFIESWKQMGQQAISIVKEDHLLVLK